MRMYELTPGQQAIYDAIRQYSQAPIDCDHLGIEQEGDSATVKFAYAPRDASEFAVELIVDTASYALACDGWHDEFPFDDEPAAVAEKLVEQLVTLFNGHTKVIVHFAGESAYHWELCFEYEAEQWETLSRVGLLFYNYFDEKHTAEKRNCLLC